MLEFLCYSFIWICAIYGFIEILKVLFYTFIKTPKIENCKIHIIIGVRNCENNIESFLRTFFNKILNYQKLDINEIVVVDMNSTDNTKNILTRLNKDYDFEYRELEK